MLLMITLSSLALSYYDVNAWMVEELCQEIFHLVFEGFQVNH